MPGLSEVERGRSEASHTVLAATEVQPYLAPEADTPFPLRYAFYLLGDIRGKVVLDLGCGSGENLAPLLARGANVIAVDLSEELVKLARGRLALTNQEMKPALMVGSAYDVPLPDGSVDAILCSSLLHHLDIPRAMAEMKRLLKPRGFAVVKEPVRFSRAFAVLRSWFPDRGDISEDEHPLTRAELLQVKSGWMSSGERAFRLPTMAAMIKVLGEKQALKFWRVDGWLLKLLTPLEHFATTRVVKLEKCSPEKALL